MKAHERFFKVGHGADNYEETIDLSEVIFIRCSFSYDSANEKWNNKANLLFQNGEREAINLTEKGYEELIKNWIKSRASAGHQAQDSTKKAKQ
jgi:hypothetical protein